VDVGASTAVRTLIVWGFEMAGETERPRRKPSVARTSTSADTTTGADKGRSQGKVAPKAPSPVRTAGASTPTAVVIERLEAAVSELTAERDRLQRTLTDAEARIAALEAQNRAAVDRINWVIDSLQSALDD